MGAFQFQLRFGWGRGLLWTIHHHSSGIMLFKHTIAVNIVSSSRPRRRRPRREHLLDLPVAMAHFAFEFDLRFAFIEDSPHSALAICSWNELSDWVTTQP